MKIKLKDVEVFYEIFGTGYPVVFIMGLGMDHSGWLLQIPYFAEHFKVIVFDNRGIGRTSIPSGPYTTNQMAEDTTNLMTALNIDKAHIVGISMGGMIAQELALNFPEKINKLVLSCTYAAPGEKEKELLTKNLKLVLGTETLNFQNIDLDKVNLNMYDLFMNVMLPLTLSEKFLRDNKEIIKQTFDKFMETNPTLEGFLNQLHATQKHNTVDRLENIKLPTLVITGDSDVLVDKSNSEFLAEKIPNSKLHIIKNGPHGINTENALEFNQAVKDFLT